MSQSSNDAAEHAKCLIESRIHMISDEWTNNIWDGDFTDLACEWPDELSDNENDAKYWGRVLENLLELCQDWPQEQPGFWVSVVEHEVSPRTVIAFLFCIMEKYPKNTLGVQAAHIYLLVTPIVGSSAYKVFHSLLFEKAINFARLASSHISTGGRKKKVAKAPTKGRGGSRAGSRKPRTASVEVSDDDDDDDQRASQQTLESRPDDLVGACTVLMQDFVSVVDHFSLKASEHCLQQIVVLYTELLRTPQMVTMVWNSDARAIARNTSVPMLAAFTLLKLCRPFHGAPTASVLLAFKQLRATFLMTWMSVQAGIVPPALGASSNLALQLVSHMCTANPDVCLTPLQILIQHLCASAPNRSDLRSRLAQTVVDLVSMLPLSSRVYMMEWLRKFVKSEKTSHRVFALDVFCSLLRHPLSPLQEEMSEDDRHVMSDLFLLRDVFARCHDKAASVRSRALAVLADVGSDLKGSVQKVLTECAPDSLNHVRKFVPMVVRRSGDEKAVVRRSALQAIELLVTLSSSTAMDTEALLQSLRDRCRDPALSVRKQALTSLSGLLQFHGRDSRVQKLWLEAVLPMVMDQETSVKQRCCQLLHSFIITHVEPAAMEMTPDRERAWSLLSHIAAKENTEMRRYFQRVVREWSIDRCLTSSLLKSLVSHVDSSSSKMAWMFLAEISLHWPLSNVQFVLEAWNKVDVESTNPEKASFILNVLAGNSRKLSSSEKTSLNQSVLDHLLRFKSDLVLVASMVQALTKLNSEAYANTSEAVRQPWAVQIVEACGQWLSQNLLRENRSGMEEANLIQHLFTLGEAAQLCPASITEQLFLLVQSLLASHKEGQQLSASQSTLATSPRIRAHAFLCLGKLCLQQEVLAKKCVSVLVRELVTGDDAIVRNNVVIVLCDLCVRYTHVIDSHLSSISACLHDDSALVSHQTLVSLTSLLKEDYIKLKGSLFFRYLLCIVSDNEKSRQFAEYCLVHMLLARHQILFSTHFVECLFHYNGYENHPTYNKFTQSEKDRQLFSLRGSKYLPKRHAIYRFLLEHMTDEQRFGATAKLCQEVLSGVVDGTMSLRGEGSGVLADALFVLCCPEIKLSSMRVHTADDMEDEVEQATVAAANAKSKLVTQLVRKNVMENIVPIVIDLKHMLEQKRSSLLRNVMQFLQDLVKDYRNEVQDILSADRQLAREIEYDLKRFEEEEGSAKEAAAIGRPPTLTPRAQLVSSLAATPCITTPIAAMSPAAGFSAPRVRGSVRTAQITPGDLLRRKMRERALASVTTAARTPGLKSRSTVRSDDMPPPSPVTRNTDNGSPTLVNYTGLVQTPSAPKRPTTLATPSLPSHAPAPQTAPRAHPASVGPPVLSRAVSTPQRHEDRNASLSFRQSLGGLIPPSPIPVLPLTRARQNAASQVVKKTSDGQPLISLPDLHKPDQGPSSQWAISSPQAQRPSSEIHDSHENEDPADGVRKESSRRSSRADAGKKKPQDRQSVRSVSPPGKRSVRHQQQHQSSSRTPDADTSTPPTAKRSRAESKTGPSDSKNSGRDCAVVVVRHAPSPQPPGKTRKSMRRKS